MIEPTRTESSAAQERHAWRNRLLVRTHRVRALLWQRWWIVVGAIAVGLGVQGTLWTRDRVRYVSTGRMIVNLKLAIPEGSLYTEELNNFLGTQAALMQSAAVLDRAQDRTQAPVLEVQPVTLRVFIQPKTTIITAIARSSPSMISGARCDAANLPAAEWCRCSSPARAMCPNRRSRYPAIPSPDRSPRRLSNR